jgi:hypothetical protein
VDKEEGGGEGGGRQVADDNVIWYMLVACWLTKATNTHLEYVILFAFAWQQWLWLMLWLYV